ncbi:MAG: VOC family protein [Acidobacteria bacterium]|nr:VOC family protein [Acidobacteriota bacterium]
MRPDSSRRRFVKAIAAAAATGSTATVAAQRSGGVRGFDHVAVPMQNTDAMVAFYRALGFPLNETPTAVSVYIGEQMINFHRPVRWQDPKDTLRAPAARPPCGDFCFVWEGTENALKATLARAGAKIELGPVERAGGRRRTGTSYYVRDPDGNLLEFMLYR